MDDQGRVSNGKLCCRLATLVDKSSRIEYIISTRKCQGSGGPPGLQNQCTGDELVGGFDSHALPP